MQRAKIAVSAAAARPCSSPRQILVGADRLHGSLQTDNYNDFSPLKVKTCSVQMQSEYVSKTNRVINPGSSQLVKLLRGTLFPGAVALF